MKQIELIRTIFARFTQNRKGLPVTHKLNRAQLAYIRGVKRECADMLFGARIITRRKMPKADDTFEFRKSGTIFEREYFTFAQLVERRLAKKAMG